MIKVGSFMGALENKISKSWKLKIKNKLVITWPINVIQQRKLHFAQSMNYETSLTNVQEYQSYVIKHVWDLQNI